MRFLPSSPGRAVAEVLLTVAVIAFVVYDLSGHTSTAKPEAASNVVLSFEAKRPSSTPVAPTQVSSSVDQLVNYLQANIFTVCGNTVAPTNPWLIGNGTNQALVIKLGGGCIPNPAITQFLPATNTSLLNGITVNSGSLLLFQNILFDNDGVAGASSGPLVMLAGSYLETIVSSALVPLAKGTVIYPLLLATGACPSFTGVNILPTLNCPTDTTLATVGSYVCAVSSINVVINGSPYCNLFLSIVGALSQSSAQITIQFSKDCSAYTPVLFTAAIFQATGVPAAAIDILVWACGSITATFVVRGSSPALIAAAVQAILASAAPGGTLYILLGVTYAGIGPMPTTYYPLPYCYYNGQTYCGTTTTHPVSSSNPALFALLTLLVIPVVLILGIFVWCCLQKEPVCAPLPVCTPAPACFFPEPTCAMPCEPCALPCDPCAAAAGPMTYSAPAPLPYSIQ